MSTLQVGDIVVGDNGYILRCGSGAYSDAIVVSVEPLVAVSREGDMLWRATIDDAHLRTVGQASAKEAERAFARWHNDQWQERVAPLRDAMSEARRDIGEWLQFARYRREASKNPSHDPACATEAGIARSEAVIEKMTTAYGAFPRPTVK